MPGCRTTGDLGWAQRDTGILRLPFATAPLREPRLGLSGAATAPERALGSEFVPEGTLSLHIECPVYRLAADSHAVIVGEAAHEAQGGLFRGPARPKIAYALEAAFPSNLRGGGHLRDLAAWRSVAYGLHAPCASACGAASREAVEAEYPGSPTIERRLHPRLIPSAFARLPYQATLDLAGLRLGRGPAEQCCLAAGPPIRLRTRDRPACRHQHRTVLRDSPSTSAALCALKPLSRRPKALRLISSL